jgi:UDP-N-acetylmuramate dehydrogenase
MEIFNNYSLKQHNTFGIECVASSVAKVESTEQLMNILMQSINKNIIVLGGGSNVLFKSNSIDSLTILNCIKGINTIDDSADSVIVESAAGVLWDDLVKFCVSKNYGGIENLAMIPGTVGAAPIQNIGAYGQEIKDVFESLTAIEIATGKTINLNNAQCNFGYRDSIFKNELKGKAIITSVRLKLSKKSKVNSYYGSIAKELEAKKISTPTIADVSNIVRKIRTDKLPDPVQFGNAGSFFKNPIITNKLYESLRKHFHDIVGYPENENNIKVPAAYLIEKCNLKALRVGNVGTFPNQPLVIVNYGNATGSEILEFSKMIKDKVFKTFQIKLQEEVNIL